MSDRPAVLKAVYATWRPVPTRKVLQLVFELPIEQTRLAMDTLGTPTNETSMWCAIARLQEPQAQPEASAAQSNTIPITKGRPFKELARSQQAALKCQDADFQYWIGVPGDLAPEMRADEADKLLKTRFCIISKKDLDRWPEAGAKWDALLTDFELRGYKR